MFNFLEKSDERIRQDVKNELKWDPSLTSTKISVTTADGIVTLRGSVPHYFEKSTAEKAAQRVGGVRAVADEMEVNLLGSYERSDEDIAEAAINALEWSYQTPKDIKITVERAWVTLRGEAEWAYQRKAAQDAISPLMGVRGVSNQITLKPSVQPADIKERIEEALKRSAKSESLNIAVAVIGTHGTLSGSVHSLSEIGDAGIAAWSAPGVSNVDNNLKLSH